MLSTQTNLNANNLVPSFSVENARFSQLSKLPVKFAYIDLDSIGTHELVNNLRNDQVATVLSSLLELGYSGPAISVFERGSDKIYDSLSTKMVKIIDDISYGQIGIADGHNRLEALKMLQARQALKYRYFPVQIIPGRQSEIVSLRVSRQNELPLAIEQIEECFKLPKLTIDPRNTTHFEVAFRDRQWRRLREGQPNIKIKREDLIGDAMISK